MPSPVEPFAFDSTATGQTADPWAYRGNQSTDPFARGSRIPFSPYQTVYYSRFIGLFLPYVSTGNPQPPPLAYDYWDISDFFISPFHLRSDSSSPLGLNFSGTTFAYTPTVLPPPVPDPLTVTDSPSCTNDSAQKSAAAMVSSIYYTGNGAGTSPPQSFSDDFLSIVERNNSHSRDGSTYSPAWTAYTISNFLNMAVFGKAVDDDVVSIMSGANPWNFIESSGASYWGTNVFGNCNVGDWGDVDIINLNDASFDGSIVQCLVPGSSSLSDYVGDVSPSMDGYFALNFPLGAGATPSSSVTLPTSGSLDINIGNVVCTTTRWFIQRKYILVSYINSTQSGPIFNSIQSDGIDYAYPGAPKWIVVPCPSLVDNIGILCSYIDDTNNGATSPLGTPPVSHSLQRSRNNANVATVETNAPHKLLTNGKVTTSGFGGTGYNLSNVVVTVIDDTHFSFPCVGAQEGPTPVADTNGIITPVPNGSNDTPNSIVTVLLQGWTNATWIAAGKPLNDAP